MVGDARGGREVERREAALPRIVEDGVEDEIPGVIVNANDRPDFGGVAARIPVLGVVAELEVHAVEEPALVGIRRDKQQPQLAAIDLCALCSGDAVEREIEAQLEPWFVAV